MAIEVTLEGPVSWVTIKRPEVLNALDIAHLLMLVAAFEDFCRADQQRVMVLSGTGKAFCVGADIKAMRDMNDADFAQAADLYQQLARLAMSTKKPLIASIQGYALGGGLEIALMCDLRLAGKSAQLGLPDAPLGFSPTGGLSYFLPRLIGVGRAMQLLLSAKMISAERAEEIGLVSWVASDEKLITETRDYAMAIADYPETCVGNIKHLCISSYEVDFESILELEARYDRDCYSDPRTKANLAAFVESREKAKI